MEKEKFDKKRILLIDDDELAIRGAMFVLHGLNCDIDFARNADEAMKHIAKYQYDIVFMNIELPNMLGFELTKKIRASEINSQKNHLIIIGLTAHVNFSLRQKCILSGMDGALPKPLTEDTATEIFREYLPDRQYEIQAPFLQIEGEVIDLDLGVSISKGDVSGAKQMIIMLVTGFKKELPDIQAAKIDNNWEKIRKYAHKYRGGSAYCGTPRLQVVTKYLDEYLNSQENTEFREDLYYQFLDEMNKVIEGSEALSKRE